MNQSQTQPGSPLGTPQHFVFFFFLFLSRRADVSIFFRRSGLMEMDIKICATASDWRPPALRVGQAVCTAQAGSLDTVCAPHNSTRHYSHCGVATVMRGGGSELAASFLPLRGSCQHSPQGRALRSCLPCPTSIPDPILL